MPIRAITDLASNIMSAVTEWMSARTNLAEVLASVDRLRLGPDAAKKEQLASERAIQEIQELLPEIILATEDTFGRYLGLNDLIVRIRDINEKIVSQDPKLYAELGEACRELNRLCICGQHVKKFNEN